MLPYVTEMVMDEENEFITTNYTQAKTANLKSLTKIKYMIFLSCFQGSDPVLVKCDKWKNYLDSYIKKSFRKIKVKKHKP